VTATRQSPFVAGSSMYVYRWCPCCTWNEFRSASGSKQGVRWTLKDGDDRVIIHTLFAPLSSLSFREHVRQLGWREEMSRGVKGFEVKWHVKRPERDIQGE